MKIYINKCLEKIFIIVIVLTFFTLNVSARNYTWMLPTFTVPNPRIFTEYYEVDKLLGSRDYYHYTHMLNNSQYKYDVYFKDKSSNIRSYPIGIISNNYVITQNPQDIKLGSSIIRKTLSDMVVYNNERITFSNQWNNGIHLIYKYNPQSLNEIIKIDSFSDLPISVSGDMLKIQFKIKAYPLNIGEDGGLNISHNSINMGDIELIENTNDIVKILDLDNKEIFIMDMPNAYDSNGNKIKLNYDIETTRFGNLKITVLTPYDWIISDNITFPIYIDPTWRYPTGDTPLTNEDPLHLGHESYDNDLNTQWQEIFNDVDMSSGLWDWGIRYDMGTSYTMSRLKIYSCWGGNEWGCPSSVGIVKVCDDSACSGESSVIPSKCLLSTSGSWVTCDFTDTDGRWIELQGGVCHENPCQDQNINALDDIHRFKEIQIETAPTTTTTTTTIACYNGLDDADDWTFDSPNECIIDEDITDGGGDILITGGGSLIVEADLLMMSGNYLRCTIQDDSSFRRRNGGRIRILK